MNKTCQICGKDSGVYPLCVEHLRQKAEGKVVKCPQCGKWHYASEPCTCKQKSTGGRETAEEFPTEGYKACLFCGAKTTGFAFCKDCFTKYTKEQKITKLNEHKKASEAEKSATRAPAANATAHTKSTEKPEMQEKAPASYQKENGVVTVNPENKSRCITCGKTTDGLLFCPSCYHKYKDKELLFRITGCTTVELLDEDYEGRYTCKDGHIVKSKSERDIDNYLFENGISHAYEKELAYGAGENEVLHPDFYLPNYLGKGKHVYLEHWGYNENNIQYTRTKKFKMPIYEKLGITLICTYEKSDSGKIDAALERKLNPVFIKENKINFEE